MDTQSWSPAFWVTRERPGHRLLDVGAWYGFLHHALLDQPVIAVPGLLGRQSATQRSRFPKGLHCGIGARWDE